VKNDHEEWNIQAISHKAGVSKATMSRVMKDEGNHQAIET